MNKRALLFTCIGLLLLNIGTVIFFTAKKEPDSSAEAVAEVGGTDITREDWLAMLEERYGKETLEQMVNSQVVQELSEKYNVTADEETVNRELTMFKLSSNTTESESAENDRQWREQIRYSILLEKLLTRDVNVPEDEVQKYYDAHKDEYSFEAAYHLSHIAVKSESQAEEIIKELDEGSSFETMAEEFASADVQQGELGFVSKGSGAPEAYLEAAAKLDKGSYSRTPVQTADGFAVLFLEEKIKGRTYSYNEVKDQIKRQLALEQMEGSVTVRPLWKEAEAEWFYGQKD
ncbi:peptidylprolyl isomerase [Bacillus mangrovi]|uniref:peptidylprolyl isomerase n=1 Tax=Metabacillus mangrovi TaxID=1491830 RepID=A0A7X2S7R9_9BACI|nr:peptidyl-prolyl cis-trans isomerase [Metabacillus mangrovi]MTH55233.1 peptidylprolyl isomerase [Metabacillus mangrovi]